MLRKSRIWKMLLLSAVIVMANLYFGCVHKYYAPSDGQYQTKEGAEIKALQKEREDEDKKQQEQQIKAMQKEIEELKQRQ